MSSAEQSQQQAREALLLARRPVDIIRNGRVVGRRWPDLHFGTMPRENAQQPPQQTKSS